MIAGEASYSVSTVKRETLSGMSGAAQGYKETPIPGFIKITLRDSADLTIEDINKMTDVTVVLELGNGKTIVGRNMWSVDSQDVNAEEGTTEAHFEGADVKEIKP
jgi:hypothetical protein